MSGWNLKISMIISCFRCEQTIEQTVTELQQALRQLARFEYEVILVGRRVNHDRANILRRLAAKHSCVSVVELDKDPGLRYVLAASLRCVEGDYVVSVDGTLTGISEWLPQLIEKLEEGYDIVFAGNGSAKEKHRFFIMRRFVRDWIVSKQVFGDRTGKELFPSARTANLGASFRHPHKGACEQTKFAFFQRGRGLFRSSFHPLRLIAGVGILLLVTGLLLLLWQPDSLLSATALLSGLILIAIRILGGYVVRIFAAVSGKSRNI